MEAVRNLEPVLIFLMLGPLNDTSKSFNRSLGKIGVDWDHIIQKNSHNLPYKLVGGIPTPLKNTKVSWDYYSQYIEKNMFQPPTSESLWAIHLIEWSDDANQQETLAILVRFLFHKSKLAMDQDTYQYHSTPINSMFRGNGHPLISILSFFEEKTHVAWSWVTTISHET